MTHGRGHENDVVAAQPQAFLIFGQDAEQRIRCMHHAFWLAGRSRSVEELSDVIGRRSLAREQGRQVHLVLPAAIQQTPLEGVFATAADHQQMGEARQVGTDIGDQRGIVTATEQPRHHHDFGLGEAEHVTQLTLSEDRHQGIDDRSQACTSEVESNELPPIRQLARDDGAIFHPHRCESGSDAADNALQLPIRQCRRRAVHAVVVDDRYLVGMAAHRVVEIVGQHPLRPVDAGPFGWCPDGKSWFSHGTRSHSFCWSSEAAPAQLRIGTAAERRKLIVQTE